MTHRNGSVKPGMTQPCHRTIFKMRDNSSPATSEHRGKAVHVVARCAIVTCSDTRSLRTDTSGQLIRSLLETDRHKIEEYRVVTDEPDEIRSLLFELAEKELDVVLINGGTGITRRDVTYDVVASMLDKTLPGFGEIFRTLSYKEIGAASMLSRAIAGTIGGTLVFSMPGSTNAVSLAMEKLIIPELRHLVWEMRR